MKTQTEKTLPTLKLSAAKKSSSKLRFKMNTLNAAVVATVFAFTTTTYGAEVMQKPQVKLDKKISSAQARLEALQAKPRKAIPQEILAKARGIILMKNLKAGLGIGVTAGGGIAMVKETGTDNWKAPVFVRAAEASWGLQIGAQKSDIIIVLMNEKALKFLKPRGSAGIGFEADAAVGPVDLGKELDTDTLKSNILVYSDAAGAFAGATVKAGGIIEAKGTNVKYYGASMQEILFGAKGKVTPQGQMLINSVQKFAGMGKAPAAKKK